MLYRLDLDLRELLQFHLDPIALSVSNYPTW